MQCLLVRVGIDQAPENGHWNGPIDHSTNEFVYVPRLEKPEYSFSPKFERKYDELNRVLRAFFQSRPKPVKSLELPTHLKGKNMHLDPDFQYLTYGDMLETRKKKKPRGHEVASLNKGDLIAFFAGLKPIDSFAENLVYGLIGLYVVEEIVNANSIHEEIRGMNAHTRRNERGKDDIIVRAKPGLSGRLTHCIPIGEPRHRAYRVREDLLKKWGGLRVKDGYIQRSAVPPWMVEPERFYEWFKTQNAQLVRENNPDFGQNWSVG